MKKERTPTTEKTTPLKVVLEDQVRRLRVPNFALVSPTNLMMFVGHLVSSPAMVHLGSHSGALVSSADDMSAALLAFKLAGCVPKFFLSPHMTSTPGAKTSKKVLSASCAAGFSFSSSSTPLSKEQKKELSREVKHVKTARLTIAEWATDRCSWPVAVSHLFLDGNNMLFADSNLRHLCLARKRFDAERLLIEMGRGVSIALGLAVTLAFDDTKHKPFQDGLFSLVRARPTHKSADAMLVQIAERDAATQLHITSDRALLVDLHRRGAMLASPSGFFELASRILSEHKTALPQ